MPMIEPFVAEFTREMASTRRLLERIPNEHWAWRPHPKSTPLGDLARHVVDIATWPYAIVTADKLDFLQADGRTPPSTTAELLAAFDASVAASEAALRATTDDVMQGSWSAVVGDHVIFTRPRPGVLRSFSLNHLYHHRGQLTVYLRLLDVPLPSIYGPTADDA